MLNVINKFITQIWNEQRLESLENYIHPNYIDHTLPPTLPNNIEGLKMWIQLTSKAFEHQTTIDEMISQDNKVVVMITIKLKHIGIFKGIEPTNKQVSVKGFRMFELLDGKIVSHHAVIDGLSLETQLKS